MAPVEAQACGRPVIAYGKGGALESIAAVNGLGLLGRATGVLFYEQSLRGLSEGILEFESREQEFDPAFIRSWARRFDTDYFVAGFRDLVSRAMRSHESTPAAVPRLLEWSSQ